MAYRRGMLTLRPLPAGLCLLMACAALRAQDVPLDPSTTNALVFEYSVWPTNNAFLVTETTNVISVTVSNWLAFTNISITGQYGTNVVDFNDAGDEPDDAADDGIFRGAVFTPLVLERTPFVLQLSLIGTDLASITNEPPADPPLMVTNRTNITYTIVPRPPNDHFTNAFRFLSGGGLAVGTNEFASIEPREPAHGSIGARDHSIWWTWAASVTGNVLVDLAGTEFPAVLSVYYGNRVSNLVALASSTNDVANQLPPNVSFMATNAATYRIAVSGVDSNSFGRVRLRVAPGGTPDTRPPVVAIQSPTPDALVSEEFIVVSGSARESFPLDSGVSNVVVQVNNAARTNAVGTDSWAALVSLPPGTNVIRAFATDYAGNTSLADSIVVRYFSPTNDYFAYSAPLIGTGGFVNVLNGGATRELGEPNHAGNDGGRSVWYWWRAPADGLLSLTTSSSPLDTLLAVYLGDSLTNLTELVSNDEGLPGSGWSELSLSVSSNEVYRIAIDSYGAAIGEFALQYVFTPQQAGTFFNLTILSGNGGSVSPPGGAFPSGARVTLTAVPQEDFGFVGWEGDIVAVENPLTLTMSRNFRLSARFRTVRFTEDFETGGFGRAPWVTDATPWIVQTNHVAGGLYAARSPVIPARESTSLTINTNTGAGSGSFDVRVSSEPAWDFFEFLIDGTVVRRWSGDVPWESFTFNLSAGTHSFTWRYSKDPNFEAGLDGAFIDNIYLPPPRTAGGGSEQASLAINLFSEGAQITLEGEAGVTYAIEAAPGLNGPWNVIATQASPSGVINILDLQAIGLNRRFYRGRVE
jgi:hypothetical protein